MAPRKFVYSGICLCGHTALQHHGGYVVNPEYIKSTGETRIPGECLAFGSNEFGGLNKRGEYHCGRYVDKDDLDIDRIKSWNGQPSC